MLNRPSRIFFTDLISQSLLNGMGNTAMNSPQVRNGRAVMKFGTEACTIAVSTQNECNPVSLDQGFPLRCFPSN